MTLTPWKPPDFGRQMAEVAARVSVIPRQTMERLDGIVADVMRVAALLPSIEELDDLEKRFVNLMVEADWPPPLDAGLPEIRELVRAFEEDPESVKGGIDQWVIDSCSEEGLLKAMRGWQTCSLCRRRAEPLAAAVKAHLNAEYYCSVPVMLAQTEGLICDFFGSKWEKYLTGKIEKRVRKNLNSAVAVGVKGHVGKALGRYYLDAVRESVRSDAVPQGAMRRNPILHGSDCAYGTLEMSWKSLLLFDTIFDSLDVVVVDGDDGLYHLPICGRCGRAPEGALTFIHISRTEDLAGRLPCKDCGAPELSA